MANYCGMFRSNYFKVKDVKKFREFVDQYPCEAIEMRVDGEDDSNRPSDVAIMSQCDGIPSNTHEDSDNGHFLNELPKHLVDGEVAVFYEVGNEKLRYLVGCSIAVHSSGKMISSYIEDVYKKMRRSFKVDPATISKPES